MANNTQFAVIYRTGGTENFKWTRVLENYRTREAAQTKAAEIERMGYKTLIHRAAQLDSNGLPESYD